MINDLFSGFRPDFIQRSFNDIQPFNHPLFRNNFICSGLASGIAVTENGRGHITHNVITGMAWAGIDVRHGGNPVISHNVVKNGMSDGIVVGKKGRSVILDNTIEG